MSARRLKVYSWGRLFHDPYIGLYLYTASGTQFQLRLAGFGLAYDHRGWTWGWQGHGGLVARLALRWWVVRRRVGRYLRVRLHRYRGVA